MAKWRLTNPLQKGHLDEVDNYLSGPEKLVSCEIIIPIVQDAKLSINHISGWASNVVRALEITWVKSESNLTILVVASENDIENFKTSVKLSYPNCEFGPTSHDVIPIWFSLENSQNYQIFDISTRHGHPFVVLNTTRQMTLISKICSVIQRSDRAWIQFVFENRDFNKTFNSLSARVQHFEREITRPVTYYRKIDGKETRLQRPHDELNAEFGSNVKGIKRHLTERMTGQQIIMSVRGIVEASNDLDIDSAFSVIDAMPFESLSSSFDHLQKYTYDIRKFYNPVNPKQTLVKINNQITDISKLEALFVHRLLPNPLRFLLKFQEQYCSSKLLHSFLGIASYYQRQPMPFLILGQELGITVHLPDPNIVHGIHSTRGQVVPKSYHAKNGFLMGEYI